MSTDIVGSRVRIRQNRIRQVVASYGLLPLVLILICAFFTYQEPRFIATRNVMNVLTQSSYLVMLAAAQLTVLLVRGFDLSMGTGLSAISVTLGLVMTGMLAGNPNSIGLAIFAAIVAALAIGLFVGMVNGACVVFLGVNPFVATLGTQGVAAGFAATVSGGFPVFGLPVAFTDVFSRANVAGVPVSVAVCVLVLVILHFMLNYTTFGRGLYLVGSNPRAAVVAGLPTSKYALFAYVVCSVVVAVVAILLTARTGSGEPNMGGGLMLQSIAAAVIGGVSLRGGLGNVFNCLLGGVLITVLQNGMDLLQVDSFLQLVILGMIFIAAVFVDRLYSAARSG
ncbi:ABC transporter permease [Mesorhizobium sp. B3-1-6]|uniref:ABC transporter permease n=1 Tax=Mesorhizobium sp. B3-1-6 TaxID=2589895 RepID=UPI001127FB12|nr:ABC transporter permease [Mesorhizobium sp. B3-1-6]TPI41337.1 ABC transporter permease [Mesorhizobium sp. B3-1-6]